MYSSTDSSSGSTTNPSNDGRQFGDNEVMQLNGTKIWGPPADWIGPPPPSNNCELYVAGIPVHWSEFELLRLFERFGKIYQFRVMLDYAGHNRGFGYVKFTTQREALRAREVMNHLYVDGRRMLQVKLSYDKKRLFVSKIPVHLPTDFVAAMLEESFPECSTIAVKYGYAFLHFADHDTAILVKKRVTPGNCILFGVEIRIVWAKESGQTEYLNQNTLIIRNLPIHMNRKMLLLELSKHVDRSNIDKCSVRDETGYLTLTDREKATEAMELLNGLPIGNCRLNFERINQPIKMLPGKMVDHDAILRLKCLANEWSIPIYLFGRIMYIDHVQYAAVLINGKRNESRIFFFMIRTDHFIDLQSRLAESIIGLIERNGCLPHQNFIVEIESSGNRIVGRVETLSPFIYKLLNPLLLLNNFHVAINELSELAMTTEQIGQHLTDFMRTYSKAVHGQIIRPNYNERRVFGCMDLQFIRATLPMNYDLNNSQYTMALCDPHTRTNFLYMDEMMDNLHGTFLSWFALIGQEHKIGGIRFGFVPNDIFKIV